MKKIIYLSLPAILFTACSDEDNVAGIQPTPGEDVMFTTSVGATTGSRTIYADEATGDASWRINWLNGDMINVYSPQCATGFQMAPYKVVNAKADGSDDNTLNYALKLDLVNETGVRWGTSNKANYYAVYPYVQGYENFTMVGTHASIKAKVEANQVNNVPTYVSADNNIFVKGDMPNNVMYANTLNVDNGTSPVNLKFVPASAVLQFNLGCLSVGASATGVVDKPITIQSITITSPNSMPIAGTLTMNFENVDNATGKPLISVSDGTNSVTLATQYNGKNVEIPAGGTMTANVFVAVPDDGYDMSSGWTITVKAMEGTFSKVLSAASGDNVMLKAGEIHQINLPKFNRETEWTYEGGSWISTIPSNVYISELSLPGAWYSYDAARGDKNEGYQAAISTTVTTAMQTLFNAGVRAFHLETRVGGTSGLFAGDQNDATVVISGTGDNTSDYYRDATAINDVVTAIAGAVANTQEYAVLMLNYTEATTQGGTNATWRGLWLQKLKSVLDGLNLSNLVTSVDKNTTLGQVRGKLIVLVCVDAESEQSTTIPSALLAYTKLDWSAETQYTSLVSNMNWSTWPGVTSTTINKTGFFLNYTVANRTLCATTRSGRGIPLISPYRWTFKGFLDTFDTYPTMTDRKKAINNLISNSKGDYEASEHNVWFLIGAGGTCSSVGSEGGVPTNGPHYVAGGSSYSSDAKEIGLNQFLAEAIDSKIANSEPSPMGLVYVNQITGNNNTYHGSDLIKAIIEMNNKFYLQRDENAVNPTPAPSRYQSSMKVDTNGWNVF